MSINKNIHKSDPYPPFNLTNLGWDSFFKDQITAVEMNSLEPARITGVQKNMFLVNNGKNEFLTTLAGKLIFHSPNDYPVIGDWVLIRDSVINIVMKRKNTLSRIAAGSHNKQSHAPGKEQIIAANLDHVWIVCGLDRDFNTRRIERFLTLVYNCGLNPVIILTKADLHSNIESFINEVEAIAFGVPVFPVSSVENSGLEQIEELLISGQTSTLVGSSGAGKSTLLNRLYGADIQLTRTIGVKFGKGRHTTTSRSLIQMPQGGMIIDNPGIREVGLWGNEDGVDDVFPEITVLAASCRFNNCSHNHEPDCKVLEGLKTGEISEDRLQNYIKMKKELSYLADRQTKSADRIEKERWKSVSLKIKEMKKHKH